MRSRRQRLGQHFLRDGRVARAIVAALPDAPARVLEVGPGRGALTRELLERFPRVRAVEVDTGLAARLGGLEAQAGLEVIHADALTSDLDALTDGQPWLVAANLPYSVGTPILRRLLRRPDLFPALVVMLQLEVGERIAARTGDRQRGLLTLEVELAGRAELLFEVAPRAFQPPPKVRSAVVRITAAPGTVPPELAARALKLAAAAFTHRRKKLSNALAGVVAAPVVSEALAACGLVDGVRPEHLSRDQWLALASRLEGPTVAK